MNAITHATYKAFTFGASYSLTSEHIHQLITVFNAPGGHVDAVLGGRTSVSTLDLHGIGRVLVKPYSRGGIIRYFIENTYLRIGKPRCRVEYEQMRHADDLGICVPEPVAYAYQGRLFYKAWLITREIRNPESLAELSRTDPDRARRVLDNVIHQVSKLIDHKIYHADLHPGNILIDPDNRVYIIDFDKSRHYRGSRNKLRDAYLKRWKRAVVKHDLPNMLFSADWKIT